MNTTLSTILALAVFGSVSITASNALAGKTIKFNGVSKGQILVNTKRRRLYVGIGGGKAIRYVVGVGRKGKQWKGTTRIISKRIKPAWSPPAQIKKDNPKIPDVIKGGSPRNPMGAAALVLATGQYAIHGTNRPKSIGKFVSYGCIRMYNKDILDLYKRVSWGAKVKVIN